MTRTALAPSYAHSPDIDPERVGFALRHTGLSCWWCDQAGWVRDHRRATTYQYRADADRAARLLAGATVTGIPRQVGSTSKGAVIVWDEYPAEKPEAPTANSYYAAANAWAAIGRAMGGGKP